MGSMSKRMNRLPGVVAAIAATLFATACRTQPSAGPSLEAVGEYALVAVDGHEVPATVHHEGATLEVRSGAFRIAPDGTCASKTVFIAPNGVEVTREVDATYTQQGSTLTMRWKGAGTTVGTVDGIMFTMDNEGMLFVYRK